MRRSNRLTGGRGSAGADNQEAALVIRGAAAWQLARAHVSLNLPSLCGRYVRELGASGEALNPSLRAPIILIVGRDGGCTRSVLRFGLTSALRQSPCGGGRVCSVPAHYFCPRQTATPASSSAENWFHMGTILHVSIVCQLT